MKTTNTDKLTKAMEWLRDEYRIFDTSQVHMHGSDLAKYLVQYETFLLSQEVKQDKLDAKESYSDNELHFYSHVLDTYCLLSPNKEGDKQITGKEGEKCEMCAINKEHFYKCPFSDCPNKK